MDLSPLPPALRADRDSLPQPVLAEIHALNGARPLPFTLHLLGAWVVIAIAIGFAVHVDTLWASALAIIVVATRHNVLGLLVHDQAHLLGYRGRWGDLLVNLFAAYPLLILSVEGYARVHLAHHRDYFSDRDPDFLRKSGEDWSFPKSLADTARLFLSDVSGINTLKLIRGKNKPVADLAFARRNPTPSWVRPLFFIVTATLLTYYGAWGIFLVYWILPILTVTQLIVRWGAICEHKYNLPGASVLESTPLIVLSWWERFLLPNLNFALHPYHHLFPGVSFSNLPRVHEIYAREGLLHQQNIFQGYAAYFRFITGRRQAA